MHDETIQKIAEMMREQAAAYRRLEAVTVQLAAAMVRGTPEKIESLTKAGESELLRMRSRLLQITGALTAFAEARGREAEKSQLGTVSRQEFERAAKELLDAARGFETVSGRAGNLALGGSSFVTACVQMCGVAPQTYRAPVLRRPEAAL